jgi:hypothetical protein
VVEGIETDVDVVEGTILLSKGVVTDNTEIGGVVIRVCDLEIGAETEESDVGLGGRDIVVGVDEGVNGLVPDRLLDIG